jgi:hypothetical protein
MDIIDERYKNGKIYKIVCNETNEVYYGSTIESLTDRIRKHNDKSCRSRQIISRNNYYYKLIEDYSCNNKYELNTRERWYIENNNCINKTIPTRTRKEYRQVNKDKKKIIDKIYYENNKEKYKEKITCNICGSITTKHNIKKHQQTKKCLDKNKI